MSKGWRVEEGEDAKGRRVIADRAFEAGNVVLEDAQAAAWCIISDRLGNYCDCCLVPMAKPLRCSACKLSCFADQDHHRHAWKAGGHRLECAALRACAPRTPPTAVRLALRCVLRHWQATGAGQPDGSRRSEVLSLQHHWEELGDGGKVACAQMGAAAHHLLRAAAPEVAERFGPRDLALLIARFGCNSHTISDDELQPVAVGIFPLGAMVNHDCRPNAVHTFAGGRMLFRAVRPIQAGEEVTTAYTELAATRWERRAALLRHHQFDIDAPPAGALPAAEGPPLSGAAAGAEHLQRRQAALRCLPPLPAAVVLPLVGCGGELRLYGCQQPPWPHDERDAALTTVGWAPAGGRAGGGGAATSWGGMWGGVQQADGLQPAADDSFELDPELQVRVGGGPAPGSRVEGPSAGAGAEPAAAITVHGWSPAAAGEHRDAILQLAQHYAAALRLQQALEVMLGGGEAAEAVHQLRQSLQALTGRPGGRAPARPVLALGVGHVLRMRVLADLHRAALAAGEWGAALEAARQLLPLYERAYQPVWPQLGLLWASVAKLEHLLERPALAATAAQAAARILRATHGGSGSVVRDMERLEFEARQELLHAAQQQRQLAAADEDRDEG